MNEQIEEFARTKLKQGLEQCTGAQTTRFKRMYSDKNLDLDINDVVDKIPCDNLDWAMRQVQNTLNKTRKEGKQQ